MPRDAKVSDWLPFARTPATVPDLLVPYWQLADEDSFLPSRKPVGQQADGWDRRRERAQERDHITELDGRRLTAREREELWL
jgi:hypothetical protein